jgi:hypothetical protein
LKFSLSLFYNGDDESQHPGREQEKAKRKNWKFKQKTTPKSAELTMGSLKSRNHKLTT